MKKIVLLTVSFLTLAAPAVAKNLGNTQPVVKNLSHAERVAEYNQENAKNPLIGGQEGNKLCDIPREILQQQSDEDKASGKDKGYWTMGQSYTYVVENHLDVVAAYFLPLKALTLQQTNVNEAVNFLDPLHVSKSDENHISGAVSFGYNPKQYFDVDIYEIE